MRINFSPHNLQELLLKDFSLQIGQLSGIDKPTQRLNKRHDFFRFPVIKPAPSCKFNFATGLNICTETFIWPWSSQELDTTKSM